MSRIKRRGLDYFPMNTDFMHDRLVRRIMKREGDGAFAILLGALSCIYADEGYYVVADELFCEDLSANLYQHSAEDVRRILSLAVEYGIFNADLYARYSILTSVEIQRQYLFSTKRRKHFTLDARYCLLDEAQAGEEVAEESAETPSAKSEENLSGKPGETPPANPGAGINVTCKPENVTSGTHSTAQHSIAQHSTSKHSTENPLLHSSPGSGGTEGADRVSAEEESFSREEEYRCKLERLQPPRDGLRRNLEGLLLNLRQFNIPLPEQYAIVLKSNFGVIGHPLWKGFAVLRESRGKIRQPGRYLLSLCK